MGDPVLETVATAPGAFFGATGLALVVVGGDGDGDNGEKEEAR